MTDIVDAATRSWMMSGIRSKNTKPEILIRSLLHRLGFRFRLHVRYLPGKPDIVLGGGRARENNTVEYF
jgi:DNA mismatch endonuclease (patch repair protein)